MAKCKSILFLHADARLSTVALPTYRDDLAVAEPTIPHATGTCTRDLGCFQLPVSRAALSFSTHAQQMAHLRCEGVLFGAQAVIDGMREYAPYNALGDGQVRFAGTVAAAGLTGEMHYAGYPATAPFAGLMSGPLGAMKIGVLDNTGGRMIIYNGRATLGPPATIGQFVSVWG